MFPAAICICMDAFRTIIVCCSFVMSFGTGPGKGTGTVAIHGFS